MKSIVTTQVLRGAPTDGSAWYDPTGGSRILRGGCYYGDAKGVRSTARDYNNTAFEGRGFRVAR